MLILLKRGIYKSGDRMNNISQMLLQGRGRKIHRQGECITIHLLSSKKRKAKYLCTDALFCTPSQRMQPWVMPNVFLCF